MPRYDYVLLDADGTLFDFDRAEHLALKRVLEERGHSFNDEVEAHYLRINNQLWAQYDRGGDQQFQAFLVVERFAALLRILGGTDDPSQLNQAYLARLGENAQLLPGAEAFCRTLAQTCTLAIITNGVGSTQHSRLAASPIAPFFSHIFISQELGYQKPRKEFFDLVCDGMGLRDRSRAVVVGDNLRADIQGGINANMDTIWYNPKHHAAEEQIAHTWTCDCFEQMREIILSPHFFAPHVEPCRKGEVGRDAT